MVTKNYRTISNRIKHLSILDFNVLTEMSKNSKALYNSALYSIRQYYFQTGKYLKWQSNYHLMKTNEHYKLLPSNCALAIIRQADQDMRGFFARLKRKRENNHKDKINIPKYKKTDKFILILDNAHFKLKDGTIRISTGKGITNKTGVRYINIKSNIDTTDKTPIELSIIPSGKFFRFVLTYKDETKKTPVAEIGNKLSIDYGISNLATMVDSTGNCQIIDGKEIKSINRWFNKIIGYYKSKLKKQKLTNRIHKLWRKRNEIFYYNFHLISKRIVEYCVKNQITEIIIGYNKEWKMNVNLGKINNQNFVQIPYGKLTSYITYKAKEYGIEVTLQEESYTSKCSSLSNEKIEKHETYNGTRIKRGLFKDITLNKVINADVNGAINIMRKSKGELIVMSIVNSGRIFRPERYNLKQLAKAS